MADLRTNHVGRGVGGGGRRDGTLTRRPGGERDQLEQREGESW